MWGTQSPLPTRLVASSTSFHTHIPPTAPQVMLNSILRHASPARFSHPPRMCLTRALSSTPPKPSTSDIKELRTQSGSAPLIAVRNALVETYTEASGFNIAAALKHLRLQEGNKIKTKTTGRAMKEGLVCLTSSSPTTLTALSISCETDFSGKSPLFVNMVQDFTAHTHTNDHATPPTPENLLTNAPDLQTIMEEAALSLRENMTVSNVIKFNHEGSFFATYVHNKVTDHPPKSTAVSMDLGKVGSYVELTGDNPPAELDAIGKQLAMHIVAAKPRYLSMDSVPPEVLAEERAFILTAMTEEEKNAKKPKSDEIKAKIAEGKLNKWAKSIVLLEQEHMASPDGGFVKKLLKQEGVECLSFGLINV